MDSSQELRDIKTRLKNSVIISPKGGGKIYKCFFCPKIFREMINAQRHILSRKKCQNEEKNVSKDDLENVIKSTPTENKMKEMKLELKRLDNNSPSKNKTENKNRQKSHEIVCHKCNENFATKALKILHTCNSILDRNISEERQARPNQANKRLDRGEVNVGQESKKQRVEQEFSIDNKDIELDNFDNETESSENNLEEGKKYSLDDIKKMKFVPEIAEDGAKSYKCLFCKKYFKDSQNNLRRHMISLHSDYKYPCPYDSCEREFGDPSTRKKHISVDHEHLHECDICEKSFPTENMKMRHVCRSSGKKSLPKNDKNTPKIDQETATNSTQNVSQPEKNKRRLVINITQNDQEMAINSTSSSETINITNRDNNKKVTTKSTSKGGPKKFPCGSCNEVFESWYYLEKHTFSVHENTNEAENQGGHNLDFNSLDDDSDKISNNPIKRRKTRKDVDVNNIREQIQNEDVLDFFQNDSKSGKKLLKCLKRISSENQFSQRHFLLMKKGVTDFGVANSEIMKLQNITFLKDDGVIDDQLNECAMKIFDQMSSRFDFDTTERNFKSNYSKYVIIPEGIIYFLMDKFKLIYKHAEQIYVTTTAALDEAPKAPVQTSHNQKNTYAQPKFRDQHENEYSDDSYDEIPDLD